MNGSLVSRTSARVGAVSVVVLGLAAIAACGARTGALDDSATSVLGDAGTTLDAGEPADGHGSIEAGGAGDANLPPLPDASPPRDATTGGAADASDDGSRPPEVAYVIDDNDSTLNRVDLPAGTLTRVGQEYGIPGTIDVAVDPQGNLYALGYQLSTLNRATAAATALASPDRPFVRIAFGPDGTLYGVPADSPDICVIDPMTGRSHVVAGMPWNYTVTGDFVILGSTFVAAANDTMGNGFYALVTVDLNSKVAQVVGPTTCDCVDGLAVHGGLLYGFDCNGSTLLLDMQTLDCSVVAKSNRTFGGAGSTP